ncbi:MAG: glycosyltransferase family 39 protein [Candidatus Promineifilaceae bacterium]|nr:glycosyltransferase family 39 protein [Candidatus Promineifilaceae bacterium]
MKPTVDQLRLPLTALLGGGLLLLLLGQSAYRSVPTPERYGLVLLMIIGAAAFLFAGRIAASRRIPEFLREPTGRVTDFLDIRPGQLILLLLALGFALMASFAAGRDTIARHLFVSVASWLIAILFVVGGSLERRAEPIHIKRQEIIFMGLILAAALLLRGLATDIIPTTFSGDEGSAGLSAMSYLRGDFNNIFTYGWFSFPSFYFGLQAAFIAVLGPTIEALRLSSAVAGALTVIAVYWLGRVLFDRLTGILAATYLALSHYHIHMSRIGLQNIWDGFFATVALLGLWDGWKNGRRLSFIISGLALGLGLYFYVSIRALPIIFLIWSAVAMLTRREAFRQRLPGLLLSAYVAFIVALPLLILFARSPDEMNAPLNRVTLLGDNLVAEMNHTGQSAVTIISQNLRQTLLGFTTEPLRLLYDPGVPLLLPIAAALFILGVIWGIWNFDLRYLLIFLPILATLISGSISANAPASQRYVMIMPLVAILIATPLSQLASWLKQFWPEYKTAVVGAVVALLLLIGLLDVNYYFREVYEHYVLGGMNTAVASDVAQYLQDQDVRYQDVYFFGFPRMGYFSHSTIPYLAPDMAGHEVVDPLTEPPTWTLTRPTIFIFLPERLSEAQQVSAAYPNGTYEERFFRDGQYLYTVYQVK